MKQFIAVAYDITDNKRRNKVCDILSAYGRRVNDSLFECCLGKKHMRELKERLALEIDRKKDIVIYYHLCRDCIEKVEKIGNIINENQVVRLI